MRNKKNTLETRRHWHSMDKGAYKEKKKELKQAVRDKLVAWAKEDEAQVWICREIIEFLQSSLAKNAKKIAALPFDLLPDNWENGIKQRKERQDG